AVLYAANEPLTSDIIENGISAEHRFNIYRNNAREGFLSALEATFPVLVALGGRDWFRQRGKAYRDAHSSRSGDLYHVGEHLPTFLATELAGTPHEYFVDVARLEWAYQEVL